MTQYSCVWTLRQLLKWLVDFLASDERDVDVTCLVLRDLVDGNVYTISLFVVAVSSDEIGYSQSYSADMTL